MPSIHANEIIRLVQDLIRQDLTVEEKLQVEEIVLAVYPGAVKRWLRTWAKSLEKRGKVVGFSWYYAPIMNGIIVGGMRSRNVKPFKFDTPVKRTIYAMIHTYLGTDFSLKELEDIVWFTTYATPQELETAVNVAQHHGVVNCAYVKAIIVGNRRKAAAVLKSQDARFTKLTQDPPDIKTGVPNVKSLQDAWIKRIKATSTDDEVERGANQKLSI